MLSQDANFNLLLHNTTSLLSFAHFCFVNNDQVYELMYHREHNNETQRFRILLTLINLYLSHFSRIIEIASVAQHAISQLTASKMMTSANTNETASLVFNVSYHFLLVLNEAHARSPNIRLYVQCLFNLACDRVTSLFPVFVDGNTLTL